MSLNSILILITVAILIRLFFPASGRKWALLVASTLAIYWMQPSTPIRYLDFWLPTVTLMITVLSWAITCPKDSVVQKESWIAGFVLLATVLLIAVTRYLSLTGILTISRPPEIWIVGIGLMLCTGLANLILKFSDKAIRSWLTGTTLFFIALLLILKTPILAQSLSFVLRSVFGQAVERASAFDIRWLGFSYVLFRLLHTLRDRQAGRLSGVTLLEYVVYVIFFPTFTAGPIDRLERFTKDLRSPLEMKAEDLGLAARRLSIGLFKKFVVADTLAIIALSESNALQVNSTGWLWVMVYAYAILIYFDFSGYTDIAIGLGKLLGFDLPENFDKPYLKPNLTQFWNNWHVTLTMWFRAYFFNPITRSLRRNHKGLKPWAIILVTQISTMLLIGLWHGVSWNFVVWGFWHGMGLFIQNRYSEWVKYKPVVKVNQPGLSKVVYFSNLFVTFNYVALGWVWFVLTTPDLSVHVFRQLFGLL